MRDGAYDQLYSEATPEFQKATSKETLLGLMKTVETTVGKPVSWKMVGVEKKMFAGPNGTINSTIYTYDVTHDHGTSTGTLTVNPQGQMLGFNFNWGNK